jgi:hypothetical protein
VVKSDHRGFAKSVWSSSRAGRRLLQIVPYGSSAGEDFGKFDIILPIRAHLINARISLGPDYMV